MGAVGAVGRAQLAIGLVDRPQQLVEHRRLFDRPGPVESRAQQAQVLLREKADRYDSILGQDGADS